MSCLLPGSRLHSTPRFEAPPAKRPTGDAGALYDNLVELRAMSDDEHVSLVVLFDTIGVAATWVPLLPSDVHDAVGLRTIRHLLFDDTDGPPQDAV